MDLDAPTGPIIDACWRRIGVRGDSSCTKLAVHVHCHNCEVFAASARALLNRPVPRAWADEWARHFAQDVPDQRDIVRRSMLVVRAGNEWFAIATDACVEVAELRPIHPIPHRADPAVLGLTNIGGQLRACLTLAALLGLSADSTAAARDAYASKRFLVLALNGLPIVLAVDQVQAVAQFTTDELHPVPATLRSAQRRFSEAIVKLSDRTIGVLDTTELANAVARALA